MADIETTVAVYATHDAAEAAVRKIGEAGLDMSHFSIIGRGYHTEEKVIGFYSTGDRVTFWGTRGAYWGGLWGLLFGGMMLTLPVVGPVMIAGSFGAVVLASLTGAVEGAVITGGLSALGAALFSIGVPEHSALQYEQALKADKFLVVARGATAEMDRARVMLQVGGPVQVDLHTGVEAVAA